MIEIFTPNFADQTNTNAQSLTVKEIVARLDPEQFKVVMLHQGEIDPRIAVRPNTHCVKWERRGNTVRLLRHYFLSAPDIYFFPREGPLDSAIFWARRHLRPRAAVVTYIVSGGLDSENVRTSMCRSIRESDEVLANSTYIAQLLERRFAVKAGVIHDGIDRRHFFPARSSRPLGDQVVLCASSFRPYKRVDVVVRHAASRPNVQFRMAGTGEEEATCQTLAHELGCKNVHFLGHLTQADLGNEMRSADVFFFPSVLEGQPQVLVQAAGCGLPCVALNSYRPDYVRDGETGFLVGSHHEMGEKLDLLLGNAELRRRMSAAAITHAQNFEWDAIVLQWQKVFLQTVSKRKAA